MQAITNVNAPEDLKNAWLRIDEAFKGVIINKAGPEECTLRDKVDEIIYEPRPLTIKKAA